MVKKKCWSEVEQNVSCQQSFDSSTAYTHWSEQFFCVLFTQLLVSYAWGSGALCGKLVFRNKMTVLQASSENHVLVPEFWKELFVNQLLYNCTFCLTKQFVFGLMFICRWWRRQNRGMSNWNWLHYYVYTCILLNATVSGTIFEILTSKWSLFGKNNLGPFNSPSP